MKDRITAPFKSERSIPGLESTDRYSNKELLNTDFYHSVEAATAACERAAKGDLEARILSIDDENPLAPLFKAVNRTLDIADSYVREAAAAMSHCSQKKFYRPVILRGLHGAYQKSAETLNEAAATMKADQRQIHSMEQNRIQMANEFEKTVLNEVNQVTASAEVLDSTASNIATDVQETEQTITTVHEATKVTTSNVSSVAAACEEFSTTIREIMNQTVRSNQLTKTAVRETADANQAVKAMADAVDNIGSVVAFINKIAAQSKLLALNARIEAARAGDAGKGFAVVASEVKDLANQTAESTHEIESHVTKLTKDADVVTEVINRIGHSISDVDQSVQSISNSISEQTQATSEISKNVNEASGRTEQISWNLGKVKEVACRSGEVAQDLRKTSTALSENAAKLHSQMQRFLMKIRNKGE